MDDLLGEFLAEADEGVAALESALATLKRDPSDFGQIDAVFRVVHTLKGTSAFLGLTRLGALAHALESVLAVNRGRRHAVSGWLLSLIEEAIDGLGAILDAIAASGVEPPGEDGDLINRLESAAAGADTDPASGSPPLRLSHGRVEDARSKIAMPPRDVQVTSGTLNGASFPRPMISTATALIDRLAAQIAQLSSIRAGLARSACGEEQVDLDCALRRLDPIIQQINGTLARLQRRPIGGVWTRAARITRELSRRLGKIVTVETHGADVEFDVRVIDRLKIALDHLVRNAVDHGIEAPAERRSKGKPEAGKIILKAYRLTDQWMVEVSDDGRGLDVARLRAAVIKRGLATDREVAMLSDSRIMRYVFAAGLSTGTSAVSGRGVGLDVVRDTVEQMRGNIEVVSQAGEGTCFLVSIPLADATVPVVLLERACQNYAVPAASVVEVITFPKGTQRRIEMIDRMPVLYRGNGLIPLADLHMLREVGIAVGSTEDKGGDVRSDAAVVVIEANGSRFGIVVDAVGERVHAAVTPIAPRLRDTALFSGYAALGRMTGILVLDPGGLAAAVSERTVSRGAAATSVAAGAMHDRLAG